MTWQRVCAAANLRSTLGCMMASAGEDKHENLMLISSHAQTTWQYCSCLIYNNMQGSIVPFAYLIRIVITHCFGL